MTDGVTDQPVAGVRRRLRQATEESHLRLERRLDLDRDMDRGDYVSLLARFFGLYAPLERILAGLDWSATGLDFERRRKLPWIEADLADFGLGAEARAALPQNARTPRPKTISEALGVLYVVEGSTLGGQVILRRLGPSLGIGPSFGGRFFGSYGGDIGPMWRAFIAAAEHEGRSEAAAAEIERAAVAAFQMFETWLSPNHGDGDAPQAPMRPQGANADAGHG